MSRPSTVGGSLAVAGSALLLFLAMVRGNASPVARAEAYTWLPPAYEFQIEGVDPATPFSAGAAAPQPAASEAVVRQAAASMVAGRSSVVTSLATSVAAVPSRPEVLTIGHRAPAVEASTAKAPAVDLGRLSELSGLVQSLYRALTEARAGNGSGPLLALSPNPGVGAPVPSGAAPGMSSEPLQLASAGGSGGSGPDFVDPNGESIAAIERRLDQQIRQNRSPSEIAQTRFTLAQAIWNSSGAEEVQIRALTLAQQSKEALDAVPNQEQDTTLIELRQAVNDWISSREGPIGKPGRLVGTTRTELKADPVLNGGLSSGF